MKKTAWADVMKAPQHIICREPETPRLIHHLMFFDTGKAISGRKGPSVRGRQGASEQRKRYEFSGTASEGICGGSRSEEEGQKVRRRKSPPAVVGKGRYGRNRRNTQQAS